MKVSEITVRNLAEYLKLDYMWLSGDETTELATFLNAAENFISGYTGLSPQKIDDHDDFVIAIYVLVADMYDNRQFCVDKSNLTRVVKAILGMHSTNLL